MRRLSLLLPALLAAAPPPAGAAPSYGDYVQGRFAAGANDLPFASSRFSAALAADPASPMLRQRAFDLALAAGDEPRALALANELSRDGVKPDMATLVRLADMVERRRWRDAEALLDGLGSDSFGVIVTPVARAWILQGRSREKEALATLEGAAPPNVAIKSYFDEHRARLLAAQGRYADSLAVWRTLVEGNAAAGAGLRLRAADAAQRSGDSRAALALLGGAQGPLLDRARTGIATGEPIAPVETPREGLASLFARLAADATQQRGLGIGLPFARIAVFLSPDRAQHQLLLAELFNRARQPAEALRALDGVDMASPWASDAVAMRATILLGEKRETEARSILEAAATAPGATALDWTRLGQLHSAEKAYGKAAEAFTRALALLPAGDPGRWTLHFLRGGALEQTGDWPRAEADLRLALAGAPEEPLVLNYLGYGLLDRGEKLEEAEALIMKAHARAPDNAAIIDSLGWVYFRTGRFAAAVDTLERALQGAPGDPTVNEHVGDAYWSVGRRVEARFRWRAALENDPTPEQKARLAAKLDYGLESAALAAATPPPPPPLPPPPAR